MDSIQQDDNNNINNYYYDNMKDDKHTTGIHPQQGKPLADILQFASLSCCKPCGRVSNAEPRASIANTQIGTIYNWPITILYKPLSSIGVSLKSKLVKTARGLFFKEVSIR